MIVSGSENQPLTLAHQLISVFVQLARIAMLPMKPRGHKCLRCFVSPEKLDAIFPWCVLFYGFIVTFVLNQQGLMKLAEQRIDGALLKNLQNHRALAFICLIVGGLWTLQNIWVGGV